MLGLQMSKCTDVRASDVEEHLSSDLRSREALEQPQRSDSSAWRTRRTQKSTLVPHEAGAMQLCNLIDREKDREAHNLLGFEKDREASRPLSFSASRRRVNSAHIKQSSPDSHIRQSRHT